MASDRIRVQAEGWNHVIERMISPRWEPVLRPWFPDGSELCVDWTWKFFQYVFTLDDPRQFTPPVGMLWSEQERAALDRYIRHAQQLAGTTLLTATNGYRVFLATLDATPVIDETTSSVDATVGFLTMFRQCYAPDELASFKRVWDLVARELHRLGADMGPLKEWKKAHARLRRVQLDDLILVQAAARGHVPEHVGRPHETPSPQDSPEQLLSTVFYGDAIHWGDRRTVIETWDSGDAILAVKRRFDARRAAIHLAHLYIGFAAIVALAVGAVRASDL
jgi:hypothetical protein